MYDSQRLTNTCNNTTNMQFKNNIKTTIIKGIKLTAEISTATKILQPLNWSCTMPGILRAVGKTTFPGSCEKPAVRISTGRLPRPPADGTHSPTLLRPDGSGAGGRAGREIRKPAG